MNLLDALKTIEAHMAPNMTIECRMLGNGKMMRKVEFNEGSSFALNNAEWEDAIKATAVLARMPTTVDEFTEKYPDAIRTSGPQDADQA